MIDDDHSQLFFFFLSKPFLNLPLPVPIPTGCNCVSASSVVRLWPSVGGGGAEMRRGLDNVISLFVSLSFRFYGSAKRSSFFLFASLFLSSRLCPPQR